MEPKRFIQIGTGGFGAYWCQTVLPRVRSFAVPVAAVDVCADALENATVYLGLPREKCYTDLETALRENEADFATVVTPIPTHEQVIDAVLADGLDILCEKPLGHDMPSSVRILRKVRTAGKKLAVTMSHRFEVEKQTVESMVKSGGYGPLRYIVSRLAMARTGDRRNEAEEPVAELIRNGMIHNLDTMRGVSGANAKTVYTNSWVNELCGTASALITVEMENGVRASLEESMANAASLDGWSDEYLRAECDEGTIVADHRKVTVQSGQGWPHPTCASIPLKTGEYWDHALIMRNFVTWLDGGCAPTTNMEDTIQACALAYAAIESARSGQVVDVQRFLKQHMEA